MMYREFVVPEDLEILEKTDVWPETLESGARLLTFHYDDGANLLFSYDLLERSVRLQWVDGAGAQTVDIFREGATCLDVRATPQEKSLVTRFDMGECRGELAVQIYPTVSIADHLLF